AVSSAFCWLTVPESSVGVSLADGVWLADAELSESSGVGVELSVSSGVELGVVVMVGVGLVGVLEIRGVGLASARGSSSTAPIPTTTRPITPPTIPAAMPVQLSTLG